MGFGSFWHWAIVLVIILLLFGAGKLPSVMGDVAKGIKSFKAGMKDDPADAPPEPPRATAEPPRLPAEPVARESERDKVS